MVFTCSFRVGHNSRRMGRRVYIIKGGIHVAYNPYETANKIVSEKKKWADANAKGEDTSPYEQSAKAYYEELRSNGRQDVADKLNASDDITASAYLKTLAPGYNSGDYNPQSAVKGVYNAKVAYDEAKAAGKDTSAAENSAKAYYAELCENGYSNARRLSEQKRRNSRRKVSKPLLSVLFRYCGR